MATRIVKPNFLIIGAARSGTTSLFQYLESHPDIFMSAVKEINFFSNEKYWALGPDWYFRHFSGATHKCIGEASTSYTSYPHSSYAPERIREYLPDARLIYVVRDPIERFISHYLHRVARGVETRDVRDIVENHPDDFLLQQGKYAYQLSRYTPLFPRERLHCLTIDSLRDDPTAAVTDIYRFLDVSTSLAQDLDYTPKNVNKRITRKSRFGRAVLQFYHRNIEQRQLPYAIKRSFSQLAEIGAKTIDKPELDDDLLATLVDYYRDDLQSFSRSFDVDTSAWKHFASA